MEATHLALIGAGLLVIGLPILESVIRRAPTEPEPLEAAIDDAGNIVQAVATPEPCIRCGIPTHFGTCPDCAYDRDTQPSGPEAA